MPYLEGSTVRQKVKQRPLKLDEALDIAVQAGEGLRAAHAKGIVHRDIKSANLMVSPQGQVKVMGFGLAQAADESLLTKTATLLGTPVYMSPEQAQRLPTDRRTDIWSLGIVIYEMLIGRTPFEGEREQAVLYGIVQEEPEPITSQRARVPLDLDWVVGKALAKDAGERYQHIDEMLVDLRAVARQVAEESDTGRPSKRPTTKVRREAPARARRRRLAWALGIAAGAVVLTMAGLAVRNFLPTTEAPLEPMRAVPLTSYPGIEGGGSFSHDGNQIAFVWNGETPNNFDVYVKVVGQDPPLRRTTDPAMDASAAWSPDGRDIVFSSGPIGEPSLWRVPVSGSASPERLPFGERGDYPGISRQGNLVYTTGEANLDIWRVNLPITDGAAVKLISSSRLENEALYSPDGNSIAFLSNRSGSYEIWKCDSDGLNPVQLTSLGAPLTAVPRWAADGKSIVFHSDPEGHFDVYVVNADRGAPRRLTSDPSVDASPTWSRNGKWIYFNSRGTGDPQCFKMPARGGPAQVVVSAGFWCRESPDGSLFYFSRDWAANWSLWRVPVEGGEEEQVLESSFDGIYEVVEEGVYFVPPSTPEAGFSVAFLRFATGAVEHVMSLERQPPMGMGLSVSPDGRSILYSQAEDFQSDIMLVENFR